jgi:hypothetical protein
MVYDLPLVEEKTKPHQVTSLHLISALAFIVSGAIIFVYNYVITWWGLALLVGGVLLAALTIARNRWVISKANASFRVLELLIAAAMAAYSFQQQWKFPEFIFSALTAALAFALYWERSATSKLFIHIDDSGINLPVTYRKRYIPWTEVEKVVFRYGTLTVDCTDNRLFQWNMAESSIDTQAFEDYCDTRIQEHIPKRVKDW